MKTTINFHTPLSSGNGHWTIKADINGVTYTATTTNSRLIDELRSDDEAEEIHAKYALCMSIILENEVEVTDEFEIV